MGHNHLRAKSCLQRT